MADTYLIWSFEHAGWWRRSQFGYTEGYWSFDEAGQFTEEEAKAICQRANFVRLNEAIVPIGEHTLAGALSEREKQQPRSAADD